jgi:hypothetical protein
VLAPFYSPSLLSFCQIAGEQAQAEEEEEAIQEHGMEGWMDGVYGFPALALARSYVKALQSNSQP